MRRGVVVHGPSARSFPCMIVDVSVGGAQLSLVATNLPSTDLALVDVRSGWVHELKVVWRGPGLVGVAFTQSAEVAGEDRAA